MICEAPGIYKGESLMSKDNWKQKTVLFLLSQNISLFGSSLVSFAIIWHITLETSSGSWMTLLILCSLMPQVLVSLWGGVLADRYSRKYIIMLADGFIALATLLLAIFYWLGYGSLWLIMGISVVRSIGAGIQTPAVNAILPQIVPGEMLTRVNGINQTLNSTLMLLSPAAGGAALAFLGIEWAFMADVITASLGILVLYFMEFERTTPEREAQSALKDLREGISYTFRSELLKYLVFYYGISFFLITPAAFLTPIMIERSFGPEVWRLTANEIVWTVGSLLGGAYVSYKGAFANKVKVIARCLIAYGVTFGLLGVAANFEAYLLIMGIAGIFLPIMVTAETVLIQERVEEMMLGRVFSIIHLIAASAMPLAMLIFGPLADIVRIEFILLGSGGLLAFAGLTFHQYSKKYETGPSF